MLGLETSQSSWQSSLAAGYIPFNPSTKLEGIHENPPPPSTIIKCMGSTDACSPGLIKIIPLTDQTLWHHRPGEAGACLWEAVLGGDRQEFLFFMRPVQNSFSFFRGSTSWSVSILFYFRNPRVTGAAVVVSPLGATVCHVENRPSLLLQSDCWTFLLIQRLWLAPRLSWF